MTIKRRLFLSNILMIAVPAIASLLVVTICIISFWIAFVNGFGVKIGDREDFDLVCALVTEEAEEALENNTDLSALEPLFSGTDITVKLCSERDTVYSYGSVNTEDKAMTAAAESLGDGATVSLNGRCLHIRKISAGENDYTLYVSGSYGDIHSYSELKTTGALVLLLIVFTIFISVLLTNRFLTKFVLRRIEEPLDILATGVHELRDGNLDFRIDYDRTDEFKPVCEDFNEMAVRLKNSVLEIQRQEQSRRELIVGISHDIRSPLTSIQAYVEGLIDGVVKTPQMRQRYLETVRSKTEELSHIVSQLFLFSKIELGEYPEEPRPLRLDKVVEDTICELSEEYSRKGLEIEAKLDPFTLNADPVWVRRVITNILENSIKYKCREKVRVHIALLRTENGFRLSFADDGPGVPDESLPRLFEALYRGDPSRRDPGSGSGLGLAIVANAAKRMGAVATAANIEHGGLEIRIDFLQEERNEENTDN